MISHSTWGLQPSSLVGSFQDGAQLVASHAMNSFKTAANSDSHCDTETSPRSMVMSRSEFMEWAERCAPSLHLCLRGTRIVLTTPPFIFNCILAPARLVPYACSCSAELISFHHLPWSQCLDQFPPYT